MKTTTILPRPRGRITVTFDVEFDLVGEEGMPPEEMLEQDLEFVRGDPTIVDTWMGTSVIVTGELVK